MVQVHDANVLSRYQAEAPVAGLVRRAGQAILSRLRSLLTDGLTADAFLVLEGGQSVAVLLRRPDGYGLVARSPELAALDGTVHAHPEFAQDAVRRALSKTVSLSPVWYS